MADGISKGMFVSGIIIAVLASSLVASVIYLQLPRRASFPPWNVTPFNEGGFAKEGFVIPQDRLYEFFIVGALNNGNSSGGYSLLYRNDTLVGRIAEVSILSGGDPATPIQPLATMEDAVTFNGTGALTSEVTRFCTNTRGWRFNGIEIRQEQDGPWTVIWRDITDYQELW